MDPLHIVIGNNVYPPIMAGGAELIVSYLAEGLVAEGHRVTVVSTCGPEMEPYPVEIRNGVEIIRFFPKNLYWSWTRAEEPGYRKGLWHLKDAWNWDAARRFRTIFAEKHPDLLHTHLIDGMSATLWQQARKRGIPVIHTAHDYHLLCPRSLLLTKSLKLCTEPTLGCRMYRQWHLHTTEWVDLFCSPSQFLIDRHVAAGLSVPNTVVRNGIPLPAPAPRQETADGVRRFLFAARLTREKGCQVVLDALRLLPPDLPFELTVAGKGPFEADFRAAAAADNRLRFAGYLQGAEKEAVFRQADCLLLPSLWYENAPVVIVEAAAYGIGVIGSRLGAIPEFVEDGETGLLFDAGDPAALAAAMERVIQEPELGLRFAKKGQALVARSSVEGMVANYLDNYLRLRNVRSMTQI